jgi:hypothetical protein
MLHMDTHITKPFHVDVLYGRPRILEDDDGSKAVMEEATVAGEPARLAAWR